METVVMKCKLIEVEVLEAFGKAIEIPTGRESEPFEFSEFLDIYLNHPDLCLSEIREELVEKLKDPNRFNLRYINDFLSRPYDSWYGNGEYSNWRIIEVFAPSLQQLVDDLLRPAGKCHEFLEQEIVHERSARKKREEKERNRAKQETERARKKVADDVTIRSETYVKGHDVGCSPTEEEVNSAMNYIAGLPAETKWVALAQHHPEAAHNGTLPIQTCLTC